MRALRAVLLLSWLTPVALSAQSPAVRTDFDVMVPMRDGVRLAADVWRPAAPGRYPVLLVRTPYLKTGLQLSEWARWFAQRGYAFAVQDTRGRGDSEGEFEFFAGDGRDGYDSIEWLADQPWANGKVGTLGLSYLGTVQWLAAKEHPPHLVCMAPTAPGGRWFDEIPYLGGAFAYAWALNWVNGVAGHISQGPNTQGLDWAKILAHRPILTTDSVMGRVMPIYRAWLEHPTEGPFWHRMELTAGDFARIDIPTLTTTGWFDADQPGSMFYWRGLMAHAPHPERHFLLIGPWTHPETFLGGALEVGDTKLPATSIVDNKAIHLAFFDWCLKGTSAAFDFPRAHVFLTGADEWRDFATDPSQATTPRKLYLSSGGRANSLVGDGRLAWAAPAESPPDRFTYDPHHPVPGDMAEVGVDRRRIQRRDDVLVYTTDPLTEPLDILGDVTLDLVAATDAFDTDFTGVLSDVAPDGTALQLGARISIRRARYRNGYDREELLTPGRAETFHLELYDIGHRFLPGHRIRLEVSSSAAPYYNPNQNTGLPVATDTAWKVAHQTIYHDATRASALTLPVLTRPATP